MVKSWIAIRLMQDMIGACVTTGGVLKIKRKEFYEHRQPLAPTVHPSPMENPPSFPHLTAFNLQGNCRTWP